MSRDLSEIHQPIGSVFASTAVPAGAGRNLLTDQQLAFYDQHGYVAGVDVLDEAQINAICAELSSFFEPEHEGKELWYEYHANESNDPQNVLFHALGAWRIGEALHDILWHEAIIRPAGQLLGGPVRFWHDQLFCKPAQHGGVVAWHQDYSYWTRTKPMAHLTCWIGLDDANCDNGCLQYIPGSHQWDLLPITGLAGDMDAIREVLNDEQWEQLNNPTAIELKRGQCSFHHPLMIHGSFANRTDGPRRAVVLNFMRDGVCSDSDEPMLDGVPPIPAGEKMDGQFFPLLSGSSTSSDSATADDS